MKAPRIFQTLLLFFVTSTCMAQSDIYIDSSLWLIDLEDIVVTAQFAPTDARNAVHNVRIIQAEEIEQQGQNTLAEILTNQLNLRVSTDPILGNGLSIQGIGGENIQVMIDGVPVIGRVNGNIDLSQIQLHTVERIEIVEGAMSAQYGSNASGGVINIITKKSQLRRIQVASQHQHENVGIWNHSVTLSGQSDKLYGSISGSRYTSQFGAIDSLRIYETEELSPGRFFRTKKTPWNPKEQMGVDGSLFYRPTDSLKLGYQFRYFDEAVSIYGERRRPQFRPYSFDETYTTIRKDHSFSAEWYPNNRLYFQSTTAFNEYERLKETRRLDFEPDTTSLVPGGQDTTGFTAFLHRSLLSSMRQGSLNWQVGLEILSEGGTGERLLDSAATDAGKVQLSNYALWGSLEYRPIDPLKLLFNLRAGYNTSYDHPLVPSIQAHWKIDKYWNLRMGYAYGFRAPSLKELYFNFVDINHFIIGNPDLKAERSRNANLQLAFDISIQDQHSLSASVRTFYNRISNRIILAAFEEARFNYQNIDEYETHGFNLRAQYRYGQILRLQLGFAHTRLYNFWSEEGEDIDRFVGLSEMQNEVQLTIPVVKTRILFTHRFIGRQIRFYEAPDGGGIREGFIEDYHLLNGSIGQSFWKDHISLTMGVKNLFNVESVSAEGGSGGAHGGAIGSQLIGWGRSYFARVQLKF